LLVGEPFLYGRFPTESIGSQTSFDAPPLLGLTGNMLNQVPETQNIIGNNVIEFNRKGDKNRRPKIRPSKAKRPPPVPRPAIIQPTREKRR
jgi:hypothetical protein